MCNTESPLGAIAHVLKSSIHAQPVVEYTFESYTDTAVCEMKRIAEKEVYPGLKAAAEIGPLSRH